MKYILQIFTGPWYAANHKPKEVIGKIGAIASRLTVDKVIIGWNTEASAYQEIGAFLHGLGIKMLLWLPVFSEISEVSEPDRAMDIFGKPVIPPIHQPGEDFLFGCPSSRRNVQIVKEIYERFFSGCGFDGVFLDKIRGQSFLNTQLEAVSHAACEKYPGIEINYREDIARTDAEYITESLAAVKSFGLEGAALCWNVLLAPEAHIDAIARMENDRSENKKLTSLPESGILFGRRKAYEDDGLPMFG